MQVFRAAVTSFFRHPIYLLIYVVWLSSMGLFMGMSVNETPSEEYYERPRVAVINRDGGHLSRGLEAFLLENGESVALEDNERALQDAVMQQQAHYIAVIPEGFSEAFLTEARRGSHEVFPELSSIATSSTAALIMMENLTNEYLAIARTYARTLTNADAQTLVERTNAAMAHDADVRVVSIADAAPPSGALMLYLQFSSYTLLLSIAICSALVMAQFGRDELRRRNLSSPLSVLSCNLQLAAACLVIMLVCWAFVVLLGCSVFSAQFSAMSSGAVGGMLLTLMSYSFFGLAFGFLIGQFTHNELMMNAATNITGLILSFLGGAWVPLSLVGEPMITIAKFTPTYYYIEALKGSLDTTSGILSSDVVVNVGIVLLFAIVLFTVGLACGRLRLDRIGAWNGLSTRASSQPVA